ncbi:maleylpyruvate isomerase N-terminal domain-containing protein [Kribbella sp. NPDC004536]|uniref:maleylpyruvate isomerase N-terminal domain-containing protein n=1 Tax=Kribbella sp. NPDC004536 TaxID=3364106 RepID=UPI0036B33BF5
MTDPTRSAELYHAAHERMAAAVQDLSAEDLDRQVPACPQWSVQDLVAHLTGVAADFVAGNLAGAPRPPWTAVQVETRRNLPMAEVLDEWTVVGPQLEKLVVDGTTSHPLVCNPYVDAAVHEADLHGAIGSGRPPTDLWLTTLGWMLDEPGPLTVVTPDGTYTARPEDGPVATVRTTSYELFRAIFGRRSAAQILNWDWDDPAHAKTWSTTLARLPQTSVSLND